MTRITLAVATLAVLALPAVAEPLTVFRDSMGRVQGYATTRGNSTTFTNERGQQTGRAVRGKDGVTIFYDAMGRQIGSTKTRR